MNNNECTCQKCTHACRERVGWFKPDEIEPAAKFLNLTVSEFLKNHCVIDWFCDEENEENYFPISPAPINAEPGDMTNYDPSGQCSFYDAYTQRCKIHPVKPYECREYQHDNEVKTIQDRHKSVALLWEDKEQWIEVLTGIVPEPIEDDGSLNKTQNLFSLFNIF